VLRLPVTPVRSLICFASGVHATLLGSCLAACTCAPGRSEGAFRARVHVQPATQLPACSHVDVSGISQVSRRSILCLCLGPGPRPNQRSLAYLSVSSMLPSLRTAKASACQLFRGSITRLQHLLPTLQEWCCHHPCKARFRLAGLPLPGGSRTLWIALKGFRSHFHSPFLDFSWRYRDELSTSHRSCLQAALRAPYRGRGCMSGLEGEGLPILFAAREAGCGQVFGRRRCWASHTLMRPASEKRQGTKSRWVGHPAVQLALWGFGRAGVELAR